MAWTNVKVRLENPNTDLVRLSNQDDHFELQRRHFAIPLYIHAAPSDNERPLEFCRRDGRLNDMTLEDRHQFCWKDVAIYGNLGMTAQDHYDLLNEVYREWFPHRANDQDISHGSFFAKFMRFWDKAGTVAEICRFHRSLERALQSFDIEIVEPLQKSADRAGLDNASPVNEYKLRRSFFDVFFVVDAGWKESGVLVVWKNADTAKKYTCEEGKGLERYDCGDYGGDLGEHCVYQCSLKRAMRLVVSLDPERAKARTEYNELLGETLGERIDN